jgi:probable rRNA maturation factor
MIYLDIQHACTATPPISDDTLTSWITCTLRARHQEKVELTLRLVNPDEMTTLNHTYRKQNKNTNVLAFPSNLPENVLVEYPLLGDIVICPHVLENESLSLNIPLKAHWAHIVIHGVLHLLGYDHIESADALIMEAIEIELLDKLGFDNPYD